MSPATSGTDRSGLRCEVITNAAGLAGLWPEWEALWRCVPDAWPFASPAWLRPWWDVFGTARPVVATVKDASGLVGVLPLYRYEDRLLPMGVGLSDCFDALLAPRAPVRAELLLALALEAACVNRCDLPDLPDGARLRTAGAPASWRITAWDGPNCPVLQLRPDPAIPKGMRRDIRQARHRAERAGGWTVERADLTTLPALLGQFFDLHAARWARRGQPGALADADVRRFHETAAPGLLRAGILRLEVLRLRGRIVAVIYALLTADRLCFYLGGFDPEGAYESPGTILMAHMVEEAAREKRREVHFLRGEETYKYAWGGIDRRNTGLTLSRVETTGA